MQENIETETRLVQIIRLPQHFPGELDLAELNRQLKNAEIHLDWTDVEPGIDIEQLGKLCVGLNLVDHIELIGSETISESLMPAILSAFEAAGSNGDTGVEELSDNETPAFGFRITK